MTDLINSAPDPVIKARATRELLAFFALVFGITFGLGAAGYLIKPPRFAQPKDIIDRLPSLRLSQNGFETCPTRASA